MTYKGVPVKLWDWYLRPRASCHLPSAQHGEPTLHIDAAKVPQFSCSPHAQRVWHHLDLTYQVLLSGVTMIMLGGSCALCADGHLYAKRNIIFVITHLFPLKQTRTSGMGLVFTVFQKFNLVTSSLVCGESFVRLATPLHFY